MRIAEISPRSLLLPFIAYWTASLLLFVASPFFDNGGLWGAWFAILLFTGACVLMFRVGRSRAARPAAELFGRLEVLASTGVLSALGSLLVLVDGLAAGVAPTQVLQGFYDRPELQHSLVTTIGSSLRIFQLVFFSYFMWFAATRRPIKIWVRACFWLILFNEFLLMFGSGHRSAIYAYACMFFFYFFVIMRTGGDMLRNAKVWVAATLVLVVFVGYSAVLQRNRAEVGYLEAQSHLVSNEAINRFGFLDAETIGTAFTMQGYFVGPYPVVKQAFLESDAVYIDPITPLGIQARANLEKLFGNLNPKGLDRLRDWAFYGGESQYSWSSVFGVAIASFGLLGGTLFLGVFFWAYGVGCALLERVFTPLNLTIVYTFFYAVSRSFDWFMHDLAIYGSLIFVGVNYIFSRSRSSSSSLNGRLQV